MEVPTVNVVVSFEPQDMMLWEQTGSFSQLIGALKGRDNTYVFKNAPNSNFLSLEHTYGYLGEGEESAKISLEFVDPEGIFEESYFDISKKGIGVPDLVSRALDDKRAMLAEAQSTLPSQQVLDKLTEDDHWYSRYSTYSQQLRDALDFEQFVNASLEELEQAIENLEDLQENSSYEDNANDLRKMMDQYNSTLKRTVWITYGIGEDLINWCPPQLFQNVYNAEYSFDGKGARVIKLNYQGVGIHPNLTKLGIKPLGNLATGVTIWGTSGRIFNKEAAKIYKERYETMRSGNPGASFDYFRLETKLFETNPNTGQSNLWTPSLHLIIWQCLIDFIQTSTQWTNTVLLFPDLDEYLKPYYDECYNYCYQDYVGWVDVGEPDITPTASQYLNIKAMKLFLEGLGFRFTETVADFQAPVDDIVFKRIEEECEEPGLVFKNFQKKNVTCMLRTDGLRQTALDALQKVFARIGEQITSTYEKEDPVTGQAHAAPNFDFTYRVETDYNTLKIMKKHGLINSDLKPALIIGDVGTILNFIDARLLQNLQFKQVAGQADPLQIAKTEGIISTRISPYDVARGVTYEYMQDIVDYNIPIPWISPFGPTSTAQGGDTYFLPDDVAIDSESDFRQIQADQPLKASRMPVFTLGTKNPNVLTVNFDINSQYTVLLNSFDFVGWTSQQLVGGILGPGSEEAVKATDLLSKIKQQQLTTPDPNLGYPRAFESLLSPYWDQNLFGAGGELMDFKGFEAVFNYFGHADYNDIQDRQFDSEQEYYKFMWEAFLTLTSKDPRMTMSIPGRSSGAQSILQYAKMADKLAQFELVAEIKTLPMFHLSTIRRTILRDSLLFCMEPTFTANYNKVDLLKKTWFSGVYQITGFKHTINAGEVNSEFLMTRYVRGGGNLFRANQKDERAWWEKNMAQGSNYMIEVGSKADG